MTSERVVVLAVTKMLSGMCTGGIALSTGEWVRPVKEFGTVLIGDLTYRDRRVIAPFDIVDFSLIKPRPKPPHREDWVCDFVRARPTLTGALQERLRFLEEHAHADQAQEILSAQRSLGLIEPSDVEVVFTMDAYSGKYEARLRMPETGPRALPVTDIKWRALGKRLLAGDENLTLNFSEIKHRLNAQRVFVALGLGRMYEGRYWPLVIGVHTYPDYSAEIDYRRL